MDVVFAAAIVGALIVPFVLAVPAAERKWLSGMEAMAVILGLVIGPVQHFLRVGTGRPFWIGRLLGSGREQATAGEGPRGFVAFTIGLCAWLLVVSIVDVLLGATVVMKWTVGAWIDWNQATLLPVTSAIGIAIGAFAFGMLRSKHEIERRATVFGLAAVLSILTFIGSLSIFYLTSRLPMDKGGRTFGFVGWLSSLVVFTTAVLAWLYLRLGPVSRVGHCTQCDYDMTASNSATRCPECGAAWTPQQAAPERTASPADGVV